MVSEAAELFASLRDSEEDGDYGRALSILNNALNDARVKSLHPVFRRNVDRVARVVRSKARRYDYTALPVIEKQANPRDYSVQIDERTGAVRPVVSLTAIDSRLEGVMGTVQSLLDQTLKPHSINLYLSSEPYLIDGGVDLQADVVKRLGESPLVNIYSVENTGPYRKICPVVFQLRKAGAPQDTPIVTVDDDCIYPRAVLETFMSSASAADVIVSHRGRGLDVDSGRLASYWDFGAPCEEPSLSSMAVGRNGVAYRLAHFPREIEAYVGPIVAPTADDLWIKWVTGVYCVPTLVLEPRAAYDQNLDFESSMDTESRTLFDTFNKTGGNDVTIRALESFFSSYAAVTMFDLLSENSNGD